MTPSLSITAASELSLPLIAEAQTVVEAPAVSSELSPEQRIMSIALPWLRIAWGSFFLITGAVEIFQGARGLYHHLRHDQDDPNPPDDETQAILMKPLSDYAYHLLHGVAYGICGICELAIALFEFGVFVTGALWSALAMTSSICFIVGNVIGVYQGVTALFEIRALLQEHGGQMTLQERCICRLHQRSALLGLINSIAYLVAWPAAVFGGPLGVIVVFAVIAVVAGTLRMAHDWYYDVSHAQLARIKLKMQRANAS